MKKIISFVVALCFGAVIFAQEGTKQALTQNAAQKMTSSKLPKGLTIGGYGQIDYNEPDGSAVGKLDIHRLIMLIGYKFNDKVSFMTEIEYEHVVELYVEQAFLKYRVNDNFNVQAGLMLVPMGIINEYHEPTTFYGVERPNVDKYIVPTTWREIGIGVTGKIDAASLKYQAYIFNGFKSFADGKGFLRGKDGLRKGRQKGIESQVSSPNFSAKLDYYGLPGLRLGLSGYFGDTQTDDTFNEASVVGVSMIGFDARYKYNDLELRGQYIASKLSGTKEYNALANKDLGAEMKGYYAEIAYGFDLKGIERLTPFVRYEAYNTQAATEGFEANKAYDRTDLVFGINYRIAKGAAFKVDYQISDNAVSGSESVKIFNAGLGIWF
ncbi:MAG: hypothetical protein COB98_09280 [Flavobacteriaceae bacterium]|nr:MAG: hypothetical protein COB98_09280 [Flavobacteriaceae bacterium]